MSPFASRPGSPFASQPRSPFASQPGSPSPPGQNASDTDLTTRLRKYLPAEALAAPTQVTASATGMAADLLPNGSRKPSIEEAMARSLRRSGAESPERRPTVEAAMARHLPRGSEAGSVAGSDVSSQTYASGDPPAAAMLPPLPVPGTEPGAPGHVAAVIATLSTRSLRAMQHAAEAAAAAAAAEGTGSRSGSLLSSPRASPGTSELAAAPAVEAVTMTPPQEPAQAAVALPHPRRVSFSAEVEEQQSAKSVSLDTLLADARQNSGTSEDDVWPPPAEDFAVESHIVIFFVCPQHGRLMRIVTHSHSACTLLRAI